MKPSLESWERMRGVNDLDDEMEVQLAAIARALRVNDPIRGYYAIANLRLAIRRWQDRTLQNLDILKAPSVN